MVSKFVYQLFNLVALKHILYRNLCEHFELQIKFKLMKLIIEINLSNIKWELVYNTVKQMELINVVYLNNSVL